MKYLLIILFVSIAGPTAIYAQVKSDKPEPYVDKGFAVWQFGSKTIGEDYTIYVIVPPGYDTAKTTSPVLYMTDGDWNMTVAMNCFNMLRQDYDTTEPIIVGIGYGDRPNKRGRDLQPSEGGPKFITFIEKELMPFVQSKYRTNGNNALYGYSLGGMLTTSVLFEHPGLFNMIFIGAPGNSGRALIPSAQKYFANHNDLNCRVFAGVGSYEHTTAKNIGEFKAYMLRKNCKSLDIETAITPDAAHGAALAQVMQNAMKFAYCKTHKEITLAAKDLEKYAGEYVAREDAKVKFKVYTVGDKLYASQGDDVPNRYVPYAGNHFFLYENERVDIVFNNENGKSYMLFIVPNEQPHRLDKVN
jgi:predicted alpha/beta superfamily hydrolase